MDIKAVSSGDLQELQRRNDQLTVMLEMGDSGVLYAAAGGQISHINGTLRRMFQIDRAVLGTLTLSAFEQHLVSMLDPAEAERLPITSMLDQLARGEVAYTQRLSQLLRFATPRRAVVQASACVSALGDLVFYFRDVTVEFEVDRMKSEFLSTAAHELRTPLASIFGFTELMINRPMRPEKQLELLQTVHRQAQSLIHLINELLDLSRIESRQGKDFHRQHCRVDGIVTQTISGLLVHGDRRQVQVRMDRGSDRILVDPEKTRQALLNVLSNAFKYSPQGGDIVLSTLHRTQPGGEEVGIHVLDHGMGMSAEHVRHVFDRFFRADPSGAIPGTGLGMSLVKEIVEAQDGQVEVDSVLGIGTAVTLWFPVAADFALSQPFPFKDSLR